MKRRLRLLWMRVWMRGAGYGRLGRLAMRIASWAAPPHRLRGSLARLSPVGFVSPTATIYHAHLKVGKHVFVGERAVLFSRDGTGQIALGDHAHIHQDCFLETGEGGKISIGSESSVHPRCQLMAYKGSIRIGKGVGIATGCAFYPYDHGMDPGRPIRSQPLVSKGDIEIGDEAWLGTGVIVLAGVRIGAGSAITAGSLVTRDIPPNVVAAGVPARVLWRREPAETPGDAGQAAYTTADIRRARA